MGALPVRLAMFVASLVGVACGDPFADHGAPDPESPDAPTDPCAAQQIRRPLWPLELPACDPSAEAQGAAVIGSGATWRIPSGCQVTVEDGDVLLTLSVEWYPTYMHDCEGTFLEVESLAPATDPELFALTPMYDVRLPQDPDPSCNVNITSASITRPSYQGCIAETHAYLFGDSSQWSGPVWLSPGAEPSLQVVGTRPCPGAPICNTGCSDAVFDEQNCGACERPCSAVCHLGGCVGQRVADDLGLEFGSFANDGETLYWSYVPEDGPRRIRQLTFDGGTPRAIDFVAEHDVLAWDTAPGAIAWLERRPTETRLRRVGAEQQDVAVAYGVLGFRDVQPVEGATVILSATADPPLIAVPTDGGPDEALAECFGGALGSVRVDDLAPRGSELLVLGDDGDDDEFAGDLWRCAADATGAIELVDDAAWESGYTVPTRAFPVIDGVYLAQFGNPTWLHWADADAGTIVREVERLDAYGIASANDSVFFVSTSSILRRTGTAVDVIVSGVNQEIGGTGALMNLGYAAGFVVMLESPPMIALPLP